MLWGWVRQSYQGLWWWLSCDMPRGGHTWPPGCPATPRPPWRSATTTTNCNPTQYYIARYTHRTHYSGGSGGGDRRRAPILDRLSLFFKFPSTDGCAIWLAPLSKLVPPYPNWRPLSKLVPPYPNWRPLSKLVPPYPNWRPLYKQLAPPIQKILDPPLH